MEELLRRKAAELAEAETKANVNESVPGSSAHESAPKNPKTGEIGGPTGKEPTRYGDWERNGRVSDF
jgi:hypothetical protein